MQPMHALVLKNTKYGTDIHLVHLVELTNTDTEPLHKQTRIAQTLTGSSLVLPSHILSVTFTLHFMRSLSYYPMSVSPPHKSIGQNKEYLDLDDLKNDQNLEV